MKVKPEDQLRELSKGTVDLIDKESLLKKLEKSYSSKKPLIVKWGADPSAPDIHLGHTVVLNKLKTFQEFGHRIIFLIGDFTARIGDPSGKTATRPPLSSEEVEKNSKTYFEQVGKILDMSKTEIRYNSEWIGKMTSFDIISLASQYTVARILERDDFAKRYSENRPISIHEFLYPLIQGYDSVALKADVEMGGTDQKFNLLVGRELQRSYDQEPQVVITTPILEGLDGVQKMSKSLGNYIGVAEPPNEIFGKVMSASDDLMIRYYELLSSVSVSEFEKMKDEMKKGSLNPRDAKMRLAGEIVERLYGKEASVDAKKSFESLFKKKEIPDDIKVFEYSCDDEKIWLPKLLAASGIVSSTSEARRMIKSNAVSIDGKKNSDTDFKLLCRGEVRRFVKVKFS